MATFTATFIVKNKTKYAIEPSKPYPNFITWGVLFKEPETILPKEYGSAGVFKLNTRQSLGVLVAYISPDPECMFVVLYNHVWFNDKERSEEHVKAVFLPADVKLTRELYDYIYNSEDITDTATYTYVDSDGKEHNLAVIASIDEQVNVNVDVELRREHHRS